MNCQSFHSNVFVRCLLEGLTELGNLASFRIHVFIFIAKSTQLTVPDLVPDILDFFLLPPYLLSYVI